MNEYSVIPLGATRRYVRFFRNTDECNLDPVYCVSGDILDVVIAHEDTVGMQMIFGLATMTLSSGEDLEG